MAARTATKAARKAVPARSAKPAKKAPAKQAPGKKAVAKKTAKKAVAKKAVAKKAVAKKAVAKKAVAKKAVARKAPATKAPAKKAPVKVAKKAPAKKAPVKVATKAPAKQAPATKAPAKQAPAKPTAPAKPVPAPAPAPAPVPEVKPIIPIAVPSARTRVKPRKGGKGAAVTPSIAPAKRPAPAVREDETPWTAAELRAVRKDLTDELARLEEELETAEAGLADLIRDSGEGAGDDQADAGSKTFEREHEMSLANNARDMIDQVKHALGRLDDRTYGACESCGKPIGKYRLQAFPRATLCLACKQAEERLSGAV